MLCLLAAVALAATSHAADTDTASMDHLLSLMEERAEVGSAVPTQLDEAVTAKAKAKRSCKTTFLSSLGNAQCKGKRLWQESKNLKGKRFKSNSKNDCMNSCKAEIKNRQEHDGNKDSGSSCCQFHKGKKQCSLHDGLDAKKKNNNKWKYLKAKTTCEYPTTGVEITPHEVLGVKKCCELEVGVDASYILPMHTCAEVRAAPFQEVYEAMMGLERKTGITNAAIKAWLKENDCRFETFPTVAPTEVPATAHSHKPHKHCPHSHRHSDTKCSKTCGGGTKNFCKREERDVDVDGCEDFCGHEEACNTQSCPTPQPTAQPTPFPTAHVCNRHAMGEAVSNCASQDQNGICYKINESSDYRCGCKSGYFCSAGCDAPHKGHTCKKITVDCVGAWSDFSSCSHVCGEEGKWVRVYSISVQAAHGGLECPHEHDEVEEASCNRHQCGCSHVHCLFERKEIYVNAGRIVNPDPLHPGKVVFAKDISMGGQFFVHKSIVVRHDAREQFGSKHKCALANKGLEQEECRCVCANHIEENSDHWEDCHKDGHLFQESCGRNDTDEEKKAHFKRHHETDKEGSEAHWLHDQANRYPQGLGKAKVLNQRSFFHSCAKQFGEMKPEDRGVVGKQGCRSEAWAQKRYAPVTDINEDWKEITGDEKAGHQHLVADIDAVQMGCAKGFRVIQTTKNRYVCIKVGAQSVFHPDIKPGSEEGRDVPEKGFLAAVKQQNYEDSHKQALNEANAAFFSS